MDPRSEINLHQVHPDLCKVIRRAAEAAHFIVIHGIRTLSEEEANVARGASQTLHSRHLPNRGGFACAVDVAALADGHISWDPKDYGPISEAIADAGRLFRIPVQWGGDWKTLKDWGHFQLPWSEYP